jgi:hypothetical protein
MDPPRHGRRRMLVSQAFTPRRSQSAGSGSPARCPSPAAGPARPAA